MPVQPTQDDVAVIAAKKKQYADNITSAQNGKTRIQTKAIPENDKKETTNKKYFDYFNSIIAAYENELKPINGVYIALPIVEQDLLNRANFTGRLYDPTGAVRDLVRVPEFDGGNTTTTTGYELTKFDLYQPNFTRLTNGLNTSCVYNNNTITGISPSDTSFRVVSAMGLSSGKEVIISDSTTSFIGNVTGISAYGSLGQHTISFDFVTPITTTVSSSASIKGSWNGLSNTDRTNKSSSLYQTVLNHYVTSINQILDQHTPFIDQQIAALQPNQDDNLNPAVLSTANTRKTQYANYRTTTDISDSGISTFTTFNSSRKTEITARVTAIPPAKAIYYDKRFFWAAERAGAQGSLETRTALNNSVTRLDNTIADNQAKQAALSVST